VKRLLLRRGFGFLSACQEQLAVPSTCPDLCPGEGLVVHDTTIEAILDQDSTFTGYIGAYDVPALLVSNGLPAGDARTWAIFSKRPDSIFVLGTRYAYTIDSMEFQLPVLARDTSVKGLEIVVHRIPFVDSTTTLAALDQNLTAATAVDSVVLPDTLAVGTLHLKIHPEAWAKLLPDSTDTTRFAVAFRIKAPVPTGLRFGSNLIGSGPTYVTYATAPTTDTTLRKQTINVPNDTANYVIAEPPLSNPDNIFMGGRSGSRTVLRFNLPKAIRDSSTVLRATLELTLTAPVSGIRDDKAAIQVLTALLDVGAKSPAFPNAVGSLTIEPGASGLQQIEVFGPVGSWFGPGGLKPTLLLGLTPEGGTFARPEFFSTRALTGRPRLRITYATSSRPGFP
jgi:hypothetical protein